jgi:hypothetical protein
MCVYMTVNSHSNGTSRGSPTDKLVPTRSQLSGEFQTASVGSCGALFECRWSAATRVESHPFDLIPIDPLRFVSICLVFGDRPLPQLDISRRVSQAGI